MKTAESDVLAMRVQALEALYQRIAATRMRGLPLLNQALQVQAVGFELAAAPAATAADGQLDALQPAAVGVLITPWFINLVWLPLQRLDLAAQVGTKAQRHVGQECFEFIAAHEDGFGHYEACSLFSPVFEFERQEAAVATARAVLEQLRQPAPAEQAAQSAPATRDKAQAPAAAPGLVAPEPSSQPGQPGAPARRAFLFGRSSATSRPPAQRPQGLTRG